MQLPIVSRIPSPRGIIVSNYMSLRSAVMAGHDVIIITGNMDLRTARRIVREIIEM